MVQRPTCYSYSYHNSEDMNNPYFCIQCDEVAECNHLCYKNYTQQIYL